MIQFALSTEKCVRLLESDNKMVFIVDLTDNSSKIKSEIENLFNVKIKKINTLIDTKGRKKAYVKFSKETPSLDIATKLGLM